MFSKILRLNHRIFRNQTWPATLPPFLKYNLIYGWNGCGKTTLSSLLRKLEKREPLPSTDGTFEIEVDGATVSATDFATNNALPAVKVFNREFVEANVFAGSNQIAPIFYFGEDSVEKQKEIERLRGEHATATQENLRLKAASDSNAASFDQYCIGQGKLIRELLSSSGKNPYNNYDKARFKTACENLKKEDYAKKRLEAAQKTEAKKKKDIQPQDDLTPITAKLPDFAALRARVSTLLSTTVISRVLPELSKDATIAAWVQTGIALHKGERSSPTCRFCNQALPAERLRALEDHFNREYQQLLGDIATAVSDCENAASASDGIQPPVKDAFYPHLRNDHSQHAQALKTFRAETRTFLDALKAVLEQKKDKPFEALDIELLLTTAVPNTVLTKDTITALNAAIDQHNATSSNLAQEIDSARKSIEDDAVAEALPTYLEKQNTSEAAQAAYNTSNVDLGKKAQAIKKLEIEISDSVKPADELTTELASYLGQNDLKFEQNGPGYVVNRNGVVAQNLSEGEKTAIAFLYFLKSLHDRSFKDANGIVVIDDPISSLDANALFCAFGYMKGKTKHTAQLFVLTHNFSFFRQVKNWFGHLNKTQAWKKKPPVASFYMLQTSAPGGVRTAQLQALDPLLLDFESEYHYLFYRVAKETSRAQPAALEEYYAMPNIARRLLEAFFAFRFPTEDNFAKQMDRATQIEEAKRARILRFLHTQSHDGKVNEPEHDPSILSETPQILVDVLKLIEAVDPTHCTEMQQVLKAAETDRQ